MLFVSRDDWYWQKRKDRKYKQERKAGREIEGERARERGGGGGRELSRACI